MDKIINFSDTGESIETRETARKFGISWMKEYTTFKNANDAVSAAIVKAVNDAIKEAA